MNPFTFLPHRVAVCNPSIRIGNSVARSFVNVRQALELLRSGNYQQQFSESGEFIGLIFGLQCGDKAVIRQYYIPEELPPYEVSNVKFIQPLTNRIPTNQRTVTPYAFA
jgi:hypothetical protein